MKQTSVEWLALQLYEKMNMSGNGNVFDDILQQAKEMHKQEIISSRMLAMTDDELSYLNAEKYYNETFVKDGISE